MKSVLYNILIQFYSVQHVFNSMLDLIFIMLFNRHKNTIVTFNRDKLYNGFIVKKANNEYSRRAITWFYRNNKIPTLKDWEMFLFIFRFNKVPTHVLQLYDKNNIPIPDKHIIIYNINNEYIEYSFDGKHILYPITFCSLLPEYYVYNISCS